MPRNLANLIKECVMEVFQEDLGEVKCPQCGTPDSKCNCKIVARVKAYSDLKKKAEAGNASPEEIEMLNKERPWVRSILHQAGYGVQGGMYPREQQEAFDPTSQGPNMAQENPYPEWNEKMRRLEEEEPAEHPHGRYAQQAGATPFLPESRQMQSTEVPWPCPHCGQETQIHVDVESPSDYVASNDCEHCGQEINDPQLDSKVMQAVMDYFVGRAEYYRDTRRDLNEGFGGATLTNAKITGIQPAGRGIGKAASYVKYKVNLDLELEAYSDSDDKQAIARDVYERISHALR